MARSNRRATSRWLTKRILPALVNRIRRRRRGGGLKPSPPHVRRSGSRFDRWGRRRGVTAGPSPEPRLRRTDPVRFPGYHRPEGSLRRRHARSRTRCTRHSRSTVSSGSPPSRPRRERPASPARGSPCAAWPKGGPRAELRPRCDDGRRSPRLADRDRPWRWSTGRRRSVPTIPGTRHRCATPAR